MEKPSEWEKLLSWAEKLLGHHLPFYITIPLGALIVVSVALGVLTGIMLLVRKMKEIWQDSLRPKAYSPEQCQLSVERRQFADHLKHELVVRNRLENWRDQQFAELEAEVEAEGSFSGIFPWVGDHRSGVRREKSLAAAVQRSTERLILVEGEPGSGKSVALRHVAFGFASRAAQSKSLRSLLPVYVNLKELKRPDGVPVNAELIRAHVITSLNRVNDRFVEQFVAEDFDKGLKEGTWIFLFDSFDEIPDVLSSIEADDVVDSYSKAISDFLAGMKLCRGVVASRSYRGPSDVSWKTFRILPLSAARQAELIKKSVFRSAVAREILTGLGNGSEDIREMARNPMLLGLLCEHIKRGDPFPASSFEVLQNYIDSRLSEDASRLSSRFSLSVDQVKETAASAAYTMTADASIGLSPSREGLFRSFARQGFSQSSVSFFSGLDALVYMRLARGELDTGGGEFTFSHRRFQEYFTTRKVVASPQLVLPGQLLTDARWRETAVVLLQTGPAQITSPIYDEVRALLNRWRASVSSTLPLTLANDPDVQLGAPSEGWHWPRGSLHVLSIVDVGVRLNPSAIPADVREEITRFLYDGFESGDLLDKKLSLEVSGALAEGDLARLMEMALELDSRLIDDVVYRQASRLTANVPRISQSVRDSIIRMSLQGELGRTLVGTKAYVARLADSGELLRTLRLVFWAPKVDIVLISGAALSALYMAPDKAWFVAWQILLCCCATYYMRHKDPLGRRFFLAGGFRVTAFLGLAGSFLRGTAAPGVSATSASIRTDFPDIYQWISHLDFATLGSYIPSWNGLAGFLSVYGLFLWIGGWYPAALHAARRGEFTAMVTWPLLPAAVIVSSDVRPSKIFRFVSGAAIAFLVTVSVFLLLGLIAHFVPWFGRLALLMFGTLLAASAVFAVVSWCRVGMDLLKVSSFAGTSAVSLADFERVYADLRTGEGAARLLHSLRDRPLAGEYLHWSSFARRALSDVGVAAATGEFAGGTHGVHHEVARSTGHKLKLDWEARRVIRDALFSILDRCSDRARS